MNEDVPCGNGPASQNHEKWSAESHLYQVRPCKQNPSARGSQNCATLSIICSFTGNSAFLCVNDVVVDLRYVSTNKYINNTVFTSSRT